MHGGGMIQIFSLTVELPPHDAWATRLLTQGHITTGTGCFSYA